MTHESLQDTIDSLDDLLDAERSALLEGNLDEIARLHASKEQLIDALNERDTANHNGLIALNTKVKRNQALLNTALDGIRSVARRLATIRRVRQSFETYDSKGRKTTAPVSTTNSVEKRA